MSSSPFDFDLNADAYSQLVTDAAVDDRIGDQDFLVTEIKDGEWAEQYGGGPFREFKGVLTSANNAKVSLTWSPPPAPDVVAEQSKGWDRKKKQGVASSISIARQLGEHYGKTPATVQTGDTFRVKVIKTWRDDSTGKGGFLRIASFLPKSTQNGASGESTAKSPF